MKRLTGYFALSAIAAALLFWPAGAQTAPQHKITLTMTPSATAVTLNIYRGTVSGGPYVKIGSLPSTPSVAGAALSYADTTGTGGTKYFYVATAVDANGFESVYSNEASATFAKNPDPPTGLAAVAN